MDFFGIGMGEILLIILVALVIWGPKRIPEITRTLGRLSRTLKRVSHDFTAELTGEIDEAKHHTSQPAEDQSTEAGTTDISKAQQSEERHQ